MIRAWCLLIAALLAACGNESSTHPKQGDLRIVTLAPHLAELVFAVGAGEQLVGVSAYTELPESAQHIGVVSDAFTVDHEALTLLKPDLMLVWESGMPASTIGQLKARGYPVQVIRTRSLGDIEQAMRRIAELTGHIDAGNARADAFRSALEALRDRYSSSTRLSVFYQVSRNPLYTVNGEHYVSEILELCAANNVFAELEQLAPNIDVEAVLARNPEVILSSGTGGDDALDVWQRFPSLAAVQADNLIILSEDALARPSDRVLIAAEAVCETLDKARSRIHS